MYKKQASVLNCTRTFLPTWNEIAGAWYAHNVIWTHNYSQLQYEGLELDCAQSS